MPANADIVAYLHQVVDLGPLADDRVTNCATVDRRACADLDLVLHDHAADLRNLEVSLAAHHVAEAVLTDLATGMDDDAIADQGIGQGRSGSNRTVASYPHIGADNGVRSDHGARFDTDPIFRAGTGVNPRMRKITCFGQRRWTQCVWKQRACSNDKRAV